MPRSVFESLKTLVGFTAEDAAHLRAMSDAVEPFLPEIADRFFREFGEHIETRGVLPPDVARMQRLRQTLLDWLRALFCGEYGEAYFTGRANVGRAHLRVGLSQHVLIAGLQLIWREMQEVMPRVPVRGKQAKLIALHKLLAIECGTMLESYRNSYAERVRQIEREAVESRLREAEQLAHVGRLSASLAHEIKNPLAGISGAIQVLRDSIDPSEPHFPVLGEVLRQINRLDHTVKDLLVYARPKPPRYHRCDLRRVIEHVTSLLRKESEFEQYTFEAVIAPDFPVFRADEHLLEQLVMNLLLNAAHASSAGQSVRLLATADDTMVQLTVEDRGCGMSAETVRRALEPFFTTKSRGTGLGLSICRKIVEAHDGSLSIRSQLGEGTEVSVKLARRPGAAAAGSANEYTRSDR